MLAQRTSIRLLLRRGLGGGLLVALAACGADTGKETDDEASETLSAAAPLKEAEAAGRGIEEPAFGLRVAFPEKADEVVQRGEGFVATKRGFTRNVLPNAPRHPWARLEAELPAVATEPMTLVVPGFEIKVREVGAEGTLAVVEQAVAYRRAGGTSYWTIAGEGVEEWLHMRAVRGEVAAQWEVQGGTLEQMGDRIMVLDESGKAQIEVSAPVAYAKGGEVVGVRLRAKGDRIELWVDADGEVLVDPAWNPATNTGIDCYYNFAVGDIDVDGDLDIISAMSAAFTYNKRGPTGAYTLAQTVTLGNDSYGQAIGDINNDGLPDVLTAGPNGAITSPNGVSINSAGTLSPLTTLYTSHNQSFYGVGIIATDLNADGNVDAAWWDTGKKLRVGLGAYQSSVTPNKFPVAPTAYTLVGGAGSQDFNAALRLADVDGDGDSDFIVGFGSTTPTNSGAISLALNNGAAVFTEQRLTAANTPFFSGDFINPQRIVSGDFNGDGKLDLAFMNVSTANTGLYIGLRTSANGAAPTYAFSNANLGSLSTTFMALEAGDFDADGKVDLIGGPYGDARLLRGNGDGTFTVDVLSLGTIYMPKAIDMDMDGKLDLVSTVGFGNLLIRYGLPPMVQGSICTTASGCATGFCVDGRCCNAQCGGSSTSDCQACSVAAGAAVDGTCAPRGAGTLCRGAVGACDAAESCDGAMDVCPSDNKVVAGTECRASAGACDIAESCNGTGNACPSDNKVAAGTECRASAGACDAAESCDGAMDVCPSDAFLPDDTVCDDNEECTQGDSCQLGACNPGEADPKCVSDGIDGCDDTSNTLCTIDIPSIPGCSLAAAGQSKSMSSGAVAIQIGAILLGLTRNRRRSRR